MTRNFSVTVGSLAGSGGNPATLSGLDIWLAQGTNVGVYAYYDSTLGRTLQRSDLATVSGGNSSSLAVAGVISRKYIDGNLTINAPVTLRQCFVNGLITNTFTGGRHFDAEYVTTDTTGVAGDWGMGVQDFTAYRCRIGGGSDGFKVGGNVTLTESWGQSKAQDTGDHCDGAQNSGAGNVGDVTVIRSALCAYASNYDTIPGAPNGGFFWADGATGTSHLVGSVFAGGAIPLRLHENGTHYVDDCRMVYNFGNTGWVGYVSTANAVAIHWAETSPNYGIAPDGTILTVVTA